jgi:hypothetical protein
MCQIFVIVCLFPPAGTFISSSTQTNDIENNITFNKSKCDEIYAVWENPTRDNYLKI